MIQILLIGIALTGIIGVVATIVLPQVSKAKVFAIFFGAFVAVSAISLVHLYLTAYTLPDGAIPIRTDQLQNK